MSLANLPSGNGFCTLPFRSENQSLSYTCNEKTNLHDEAAVSFRAGRSLVALRDLFYSCVLPAGRDRKRESTIRGRWSVFVTKLKGSGTNGLIAEVGEAGV